MQLRGRVAHDVLWVGIRGVVAKPATAQPGGGGGEVVGIQEIAVRPTPYLREGEAAAELVRRIQAWAGGRPVTAPRAHQLGDYYQSLGLELDGVLGEPQHKGDFHLLVLEVPVAPAPMSLPMRPGVVITEWANHAAEAFSDSLQNGDDEARQVMQGTQSIVHHMIGNMVERAPQHVFALTSGVEAGDIQAVATVDEEEAPRASWESVLIREVVANPTVEGRRAITELTRRIRAWAQGRPVTVSDLASARDYYKGLGFDGPEDVVSAAGSNEPEGPASGERLAMVALDA